MVHKSQKLWIEAENLELWGRNATLCVTRPANQYLLEQDICIIKYSASRKFSLLVIVSLLAVATSNLIVY